MNNIYTASRTLYPCTASNLIKAGAYTKLVCSIKTVKSLTNTPIMLKKIAYFFQGTPSEISSLTTRAKDAPCHACVTSVFGLNRATEKQAKHCDLLRHKD